MSVEKLKDDVTSLRSASILNAKPLADKALSSALEVIEVQDRNIQSLIDFGRVNQEKITALQWEVAKVKDELAALKANLKPSALQEG